MAFLVPAICFAYDPETKTDSASSSAGHSPVVQTVEQKEFEAGEMIIHHISDAHEWHLWGHTHIPLPVILKTDKGWEFFSSGNFRQGEHHELGVYQGTHYAYKLDDHGKIVAWDALADKPVQTASILDISITKNVVTLFIVVGLMMFVFFSIAKAYKKKPGQAPKGMQSFFEPLIVFVRDDIAKASIGPKYERYMPYLLTVFFFIWISNMLGLIPIFPGGANFTGNIAITMTLAVITFLITTFSANRHYWRHIFAMPGVPIPILIILTPIEILGMFLKPIVLMIRLFANITAGHIIALSFYSLIFIFGKGGEAFGTGIGVSIGSIAFTVFMMVLELLVAFLQAYVFTLLSAIYFGSAVEEHHHPNEDFDGLPNAQHAH
ncbi:MAG TPA: F0F1 ATP synthase subunit A [Bacteroidia bacterium]|nr:F0F1 ATP synthase subunit A [Bacteroidia bacterium]